MQFITCCSPKKASEETIIPPQNKFSSAVTNFFDFVKVPCQPQLEFKAHIERERGEDWGLQFDYGYRDGLLVLRVMQDGLIAEYNECHPDEMIEAGDLIEKINSESESAQKMKDILLNKDSLYLSVMKPERFIAALERPSTENGKPHKWGFDIDFGYRKGLLVNEVSSGLISAYNATHCDQMIEAGDCIEQVNGVRHSSTEMRDVVLNGRRLEMVVRKARNSGLNGGVAKLRQDVAIPSFNSQDVAMTSFNLQYPAISSFSSQTPVTPNGKHQPAAASMFYAQPGSPPTNVGSPMQALVYSPSMIISPMAAGQTYSIPQPPPHTGYAVPILQPP